MNPQTDNLPCRAPIWAKGKEPLPPGLTEAERPMLEEGKKWERYTAMGMESCATKALLAGAGGFVLGGGFSLMSASFAYEDPYLRSLNQKEATLSTPQKASKIMRDMGKNAYSSGKSFGKVGALYASIECVVESYRAKNDIWNSIISGFAAGGILARGSGPKAAFGGGLAFAAFSSAIDLYLRREPADDD